MNKLFICLTTLFLVSGLVTGEEKVRWPRVLLLGDSLTELSFTDDGKWGSMLADKLRKRADVLNRGFSGLNAEQYNDILGEVMKGQDSESIAAVTILLGTNDANQQSSGHVDLHTFASQLIGLISKLKTEHDIDPKKIVLIGPPPTLESFIDTKKYADVVVTVGYTYRISTINLYPLFSYPIKKHIPVFVDGIHFNSQGAKLAFAVIWTMVSEKIDNFLS